MAEELRLFLRTLLYVAAVAVVYWFVSHDAPGTALLGILAVALAAFLGAATAMAPASLADLRPAPGDPVGRALGTLNRLIGFHERADAAPPLQGGPEVVPLGSAWPIVTAAGMVLVGLGLVFGAWLTVPGVTLLVLGGLGWLTQLDRD